MVKKPAYNRKSDKMIHPRAAAVDITCDLLCAPLERVGKEMDLRWGVNVLPTLVSVESAARWAKAVNGLEAAVKEQDASKTKAWVEVCLRGYAAMDKEAIEAGRKFADPEIWEYEFNGHVFGVIADNKEWPAAYAKRPGLTIYTMREVAIALAASADIVATVKDAFPGAQVTEIWSDPDWDAAVGDPMPEL